MNLTMCNHRRSAGFTMLEVMIAIVILAFGLLGIAGLQAFALKNTHSASLRLTATELAHDMIDRMKSNYVGVSAGEYDKPAVASYATAGVDCDKTPCTVVQVGEHDRGQWQARVAGSLPGGVGIVCLDSTPVDGPSAAQPECDGLGEVMYVVKIWWTDDRTTRTTAVPPPQLFWTAFNP